jgi:hypothetical protein
MTLPPALGQIETNGTFESLASLQARLRDQQETALIQVRVDEVRQIVFVYAHGILAGSYVVEEGIRKPIPQADLASVWNGAGASIQSVDSSGKFGRMAWLGLESSVEGRSDIHAEAEWRQQLQEWKRLDFNGLVEISTKTGQGYLFFANGAMIPSESAFIGNLNLGPAGSPAFEDHQAMNVTTFAPVVDSHPFQCLLLRQCSTKWGNGVLMRFQNLAGQKFAQAVGRELTMQIQPWQWQITVEDQSIRDEHFFPSVATATHAYRAIFMGLGAQMGFVIGNTFTQRILSEIYYELDSEERTILASHRLIPAAFSE